MRGEGDLCCRAALATDKKVAAWRTSGARNLAPNGMHAEYAVREFGAVYVRADVITEEIGTMLEQLVDCASG